MMMMTDDDVLVGTMPSTGRKGLVTPKRPIAPGNQGLPTKY